MFLKFLLAVLALLAPATMAELIEYPVPVDDPAVAAVCVGINAGIFPHPDPALCYVYISCTFERPLVYQCASGLLFDPDTLRCVPGNREECVDRAEPDWNAVCSGVSYAFHANPAVCWKFVFCQLGLPNRFTCLEGEVWSQKDGACLPGDRDTCEVLDVGGLCQGRPDGPISHPTDCARYLDCSGGQTTVRECLRGLVFDASVGRCVVGNTETCAPAENVCRGVANDLRPHPNECHLFVFCSLGEASVLVCPPNEIFRPDIRFCVPGNRVTCEFSPVETACVGRPPGVVPHPDSCELYLSCNNGVATVQSCPSGSIFNPQTGSCAEGDRDTCLVTEGLCDLQPDETILEHPHRCGLFIICRGGNAFVNPCPPGEILRVDAQFCVPGNPDTCERFPLETMCEGRDGGLRLPHPTDCARFVLCAQGQAVETTCPTGNIFNAPSQNCIPGNVQTCTPLTGICADVPEGTVLPQPDRCDFFIWCIEGRPSVNSCPPGEILRPEAQFCVPGNAETCAFEPIDRMCLGQADFTQFPYPDRCDLFVRCEGQVSLVNQCPAGSIYNAPTRSCVPGNADTCQRFEGLCDGRPDGSHPHPTVCTSFIVCDAGYVFFVACPAGHVFLTAESRCVVGNTATCEARLDLCDGLENLGTIVEHPNECNLYTVCLIGEPIVLPCPPGQILNVNEQFCVPGNADTCQFDPVETMCRETVDGTIFPHPSAPGCTRFVQCEGGVASEMECPAGTIFNAPQGRCEPGITDTCQSLTGVCNGRPDGWVIEHPSECGLFLWCQGNNVFVLPCPDREILRPDAQFCVPGDVNTCTFDPVDRMCDGRQSGLVYPHPSDCSSSVRCEGGRPVIETCRPGTIYRQQAQGCVPGNADTCELLETFCIGRPNGVFPHPGGCELFLMCTGGITSALRCPEGEILHPEFLTCATGNADDCTLAPVTTEPPIISVCEGRPDGNYTHPLLCYLFIRCTNGETDILSCPPNQIFVGAIRDCAPGNQETCVPF